MHNQPFPKRPSIDSEGRVNHKEQEIFFALVDLRELILKYGVQEVLKQIDEDTFWKLFYALNDHDWTMEKYGSYKK